MTTYFGSLMTFFFVIEFYAGSEVVMQCFVGADSKQ